MARQSAYVVTSKAFEKFDRSSVIVQQEIEDLTMEIANQAADKMRELISTKGTNRVWQRSWFSEKTGRYRDRSGPGRIDSGDMLNNVDVQFQRGDKQSRAAFGWIKKYEKYYKFQEEGFTHIFRNAKVPGMFALRDARRYAVSKLPQVSKKYQNRIARRLSQ